MIFVIKLLLFLSFIPMLLLRKNPRLQRWFMLSVLWSGITLLALALIDPRIHHWVYLIYFVVLLIVGSVGWRYRGRFW
ncbi:MAG: hypothetical protein VXW65_05060 [Pseudomonadota bacterium]|nr:hypothetical protein [Pseudomonadota bacterium]